VEWVLIFVICIDLGPAAMGACSQSSYMTRHRKRDRARGKLRGPFYVVCGPPRGRLILQSSPRIPLLDPYHVPPPCGKPRGPRAPRSAASSGLQKAELLAQSPNQVWSWDITKLMGPAKWTYFCLYVIIDIYDRRLVGCFSRRRQPCGQLPLSGSAAFTRPDRHALSRKMRLSRPTGPQPPFR
jgi:transposase InsO family protein